MSQVPNKEQADYMLSTAHKMKGLEEPYVQLADDFCVELAAVERQRQLVQAAAAAGLPLGAVVPAAAVGNGGAGGGPGVAHHVPAGPVVGALAAGNVAGVAAALAGNGGGGMQQQQALVQQGQQQQGQGQAAEELDEQNLVYVAASRAQVGLFCNEDLAKLMLNGHGPKEIGLKVREWLVPAASANWGGGGHALCDMSLHEHIQMTHRHYPTDSREGSLVV